MNKRVIERLTDLGVDLFRVNTSHTEIVDLSTIIEKIRNYSTVPICIDTEGAQIRTGKFVDGNIFLEENQLLEICRESIQGDIQRFNLYPNSIIEDLVIGDIINIDFNSVLVQVIDKTKSHLTVRVLSGGLIGSNKAVSLQKQISLPPLTKKDKQAISIALDFDINYFALSFANTVDDVIMLKSIIGKNRFIISKIESLDGLRNLIEICTESDAVLIDRGDLSRQVPIERLPLIQKKIIRKAKRLKTKVYVATNLMESMISNPSPTRAEVNDVFNTLADNADGLVLAAETAIGEYPIQCATMIKRITNQFSEMKYKRNISLNNLGAGYSLMLNEPHGGVLVDRLVKPEEIINISCNKEIDVDLSTLMDVEQIAIGTFSPIKGFMNKEEIDLVLQDYRLPNNIVWPIPIFLQINKEYCDRLEIGDCISLLLNGTNEAYATLLINDLFQYDLNILSEKMFGTNDANHPGVNRLISKGNNFIGGEIQLIKYLASHQKLYDFTPTDTRMIFENKGWNRVVGFHTRNVPHRVHEYIQLQALENYNCDGLFIHPIVGQKKAGDFEKELILKTYDAILNKYYPKGQTLLGSFNSYSRYAGPREAVFTAICRKNFGCSHFIIGRDHTGIGNYYNNNDAQKLLDKIGDIGITPIYFDTIKYSTEKKEYINNATQQEDDKIINISGSEARNMFKKKIKPPEWFIRKEVSNIIIDYINDGNKAFIE